MKLAKIIVPYDNPSFYEDGRVPTIAPNVVKNVIKEMTRELGVDLVRVPNLSDKGATAEFMEDLTRRFSVANTSPSSLEEEEEEDEEPINILWHHGEGPRNRRGMVLHLVSNDVLDVLLAAFGWNTELGEHAPSKSQKKKMAFRRGKIFCAWKDWAYSVSPWEFCPYNSSLRDLMKETFDYWFNSRISLSEFEKERLPYSAFLKAFGRAEIMMDGDISEGEDSFPEHFTIDLGDVKLVDFDKPLPKKKRRKNRKKKDEAAPVIAPSKKEKEKEKDDSILLANLQDDIDERLENRVALIIATSKKKEKKERDDDILLANLQDDINERLEGEVNETSIKEELEYFDADLRALHQEIMQLDYEEDKRPLGTRVAKLMKRRFTLEKKEVKEKQEKEEEKKEEEKMDVSCKICFENDANTCIVPWYAA
jgi:hypothetical protein